MLTNLKPALSVALILAAMAASKHAFRHQTTTTQQRAPVSSLSSPGSVRSTIPLRSMGRVNQPGNFKIEDTDYDESLGN
jgi:hypothetical protein